jgi:hypothetical protein
MMYTVTVYLDMNGQPWQWSAMDICLGDEPFFLSETPNLMGAIEGALRRVLVASGNFKITIVGRSVVQPDAK